MATPGVQTTHNLPTIALVGRANVGKSTFFNALLQENKALISDIAGTTRTLNRGICIWRGKEIMVVDTGGVDNDENEQFAQEILSQADEALDEADIIVMVTDIKSGIMPQERELAHTLKKKYKKPIMLVANKADSKKLEREILNGDWAQLILGDPTPLSAANGRGIGDFLDMVYSTLQKLPIRPKKTKEIDDSIRVSLIGKPNVGKSSLFNKLIGQDKVIVSDIAHTTREPYDTMMSYEHADKKHKITFVDTAGIRRKANVKGKLEREGISRSIKSIEDSNIVLLVLDGSEPISSQDMQLGGLIERRSKSVIILVNKWDLAQDNSDAYRNDVIKMIYSHFPHLDFAPILFVSGKTGYRIQQIFPLLIKINEARKTEIAPKLLERLLERITAQHKPSRGKGTRQPKILGLKQLKSDPPIFEIRIKFRTSVHRSYINFIENRLREEYNFLGTPIVIKMTKMKRT